jgi:hypothetical protein
MQILEISRAQTRSDPPPDQVPIKGRIPISSGSPREPYGIRTSFKSFTLVERVVSTRNPQGIRVLFNRSYGKPGSIRPPLAASPNKHGGTCSIAPSPKLSPHSLPNQRKWNAVSPCSVENRQYIHSVKFGFHFTQGSNWNHCPYHPNDEKSQNKRLRIAKHRMFDLYPMGALLTEDPHTEP